MSSKGLKSRDKIDPKYKWNIEAMISDESTIDADLQKIRTQAEKYAAKYAGHLSIEPHSATWQGDLGERGLDLTIRYMRSLIV